MDKFVFDNGTISEGLTNELSCIYIYECWQKFSNSILLVTPNLYTANKFERLLKTYSDSVYLFPMDDFFTSLAVAVSPELKLKRLETLDKLDKKCIVVTNLMGYLRLLPNKNYQDGLKINLKKGMEISRDSLVDTFERLGYHRDSMVTSTGEYAVRGFVLDVFLIDEEHPIRILFDGDVIEDLRYFDENSQRTILPVDDILCKPIDEIIGDESSSLYEYMNSPRVVFYDFPQMKVAYEKLLMVENAYCLEQNISSERFFWELDSINPLEVLYINSISNELQKKGVIHYNSREIDNFKGNFSLLRDKVNGFLLKKMRVVLVLSLKNQIDEMRELFDGNVAIVKKDDIRLGVVNIIKGKINHGFIWDNLVVISEFDIEEVKEEIKYKNNLHIGKKVRDLSSLQAGDYVVHRTHGIGIYNGVTTLKVGNLQKDYVLISYLGNDKVYVPVEKISSIYKYSDKDGMKPQVNSLNSTAWQRKKMAVQKKIKDISGELIKLYAKRSSVVGEAYKDYAEEQIFANDFVYEETHDQLLAIKDVLQDLDSPVPMDRLLCGDVGFGKTEVAFRGMFKTVCNNRQVMYLCPTTILSKQQYESALERFKNFPVSIRLFNRFTSTKEANEIINDFALGKIDILFGTHRLLSDELKPKCLGLLVIDEEQRFGVTHKEKIKKYKADVNVLTLSATPIPRTLKMSLSGLRDLSIIDTPPVNRYPIQTYVISESDLLIRDAIYKEISRGGQVFVLYNLIDSIEEVMMNLQKLVPEARIRYAHGRLMKNELDNIMADFINGDFDVLISTTIIETGIDIPNANTLIIYNADCFGLSQLYQLRGRVGRSNRIAYAYLLYNKNKMLNDVAVKRLQAIRDFTELGSGYKIAMRDLSIRGAGDILGSEQAGFVSSVGISLYMKMIEEEVQRLKGEAVIPEEEEDALLKVDTHIDSSYVSDEDIRIEIHQMINEIDSLEKLENVKSSLIDRFGKVTPEMDIYMYEEWFEKLARKLEISNVVQNTRFVSLSLSTNISNLIKGDKLFLEALSINPNFQIKYENKMIVISLGLLHLKRHFIYDVVSLLEKICEDLGV